MQNVHKSERKPQKLIYGINRKWRAKIADSGSGGGEGGAEEEAEEGGG